MSRAVVALAVLATAAAVALLAVRASGGGPASAAAKVVPADALVYVHLSTDPGRDADARLARVLGRLPAVAALRDGALRRVGRGSRGFSFARDVRPWLGDGAALALLPAGRPGVADSLIVAAVRDRELARVFVARAGARRIATYRGVDVARLGATAAAVAGDVLLVGPEPGVRAAIDRAQGRGRALADVPAFARAMAGGEEVEDRGLELYATAAGARGFVAPRLGRLGTLVAGPGATGLHAAIGPAGRAGLEARVRIGRRPAPGRGFAPSLIGAAPREAAGVLALGSLDPLAARLIGAAPAVAAAARSAGVDVERDLLAPLRGGEVALWATPGDPVPGLALAARTRDPRRTREALGRLQGPLAEALAPAAELAGRVPQFEQRDAGGVPAFALALAPGVELLYAVLGSRVVVATSATAIARVRRGGPGLLATRAARGLELPEEGLQAAAFGSPPRLLDLADALGLAEPLGIAGARADLARIATLSVVAERAGAGVAADVRLTVR